MKFSMDKEEKKLVKPFDGTKGKALLIAIIAWFVFFLCGGYYYNVQEVPILYGWIPAVLIWYHILFVWAVVLNYFMFYKAGAGKGL